MPGGGKADEVVARMLKKPPAERLKLLHDSKNPQAQFLWAILRDSFHYAAVHLADIAESARDVDFAMRWGFGTSQGPFELWQQAGWAQVAQWVKEDIDAGRALSSAPLPAWVSEGPVAERGGVHQPEGSWSASERRFVAPRALPVYERQPFRESVFGAEAPAPLKSGTEVFRNDEIRVWTLDGEVLIASITAKLHLISPAVIEGLLKAVDAAEASYKGLVIWSPDDVFSAGANLEALMPVFMKSGGKGIVPEVKKLQDAMLRMRYAAVPVVAAVRGMALGGGNEVALHCARRVAAMESYMGFVEVGVGLVPGGGGLTFVARRAAEMASAGNANVDLLKFLTDGFTSAAMAKVGTSAIESRKLGYLIEGDVVVAAQGRAAARRDRAGRGDARERLAPAAEGAVPGRRQERDRDDQGAARQHARRRLHQRARLPHRRADRRGRLRRRRRRRLAGRRGVPDDDGAHPLLRPARRPEDAGTDHGNAAERETRSQLKEHT